MINLARQVYRSINLKKKLSLGAVSGPRKVAYKHGFGDLRIKRRGENQPPRNSGRLHCISPFYRASRVVKLPAGYGSRWLLRFRRRSEPSRSWRVPAVWGRLRRAAEI